MAGIIGRVTDVEEKEDHTDVTVVFMYPGLNQLGTTRTILDSRAKVRAALQTGLITGDVATEALKTIGNAFPADFLSDPPMPMGPELDKKFTIVDRRLLKKGSWLEPGKREVTVRVRT